MAGIFLRWPNRAIAWLIDCAEIRMRADRRLGEMMQEQKETDLALVSTT